MDLRCFSIYRRFWKCHVYDVLRCWTRVSLIINRTHARSGSISKLPRIQPIKKYKVKTLYWHFFSVIVYWFEYVFNRHLLTFALLLHIVHTEYPSVLFHKWAQMNFIDGNFNTTAIFAVAKRFPRDFFITTNQWNGRIITWLGCS